MHYLVFERAENGSVRDPHTGAMVEAGPPGGAPVYSRVQTVVEAKNPEQAVRAVMAQTRRMGDSYAVVECHFHSFVSEGETVVKNGVIQAARFPQLGNGDDGPDYTSDIDEALKEDAAL